MTSLATLLLLFTPGFCQISRYANRPRILNDDNQILQLPPMLYGNEDSITDLEKMPSDQQPAWYSNFRHFQKYMQNNLKFNLEPNFYKHSAFKKHKPSYKKHKPLAYKQYKSSDSKMFPNYFHVPSGYNEYIPDSYKKNKPIYKEYKPNSYKKYMSSSSKNYTPIIPMNEQLESRSYSKRPLSYKEYKPSSYKSYYQELNNQLYYDQTPDANRDYRPGYEDRNDSWLNNKIPNKQPDDPMFNIMNGPFGYNGIYEVLVD